MKRKTLTAADLSLVVVFDNYPHREGLVTSWGFSCLLRGAGKTVLFDTGGDGAILLNNMRRLGIDPREIDLVVLSHAHGDHTGGLGALLAFNPGVVVSLPAAFPVSFKEQVRDAGASVVEVNGPQELDEGVLSTGELGSGPIEQSLVLRTDQGLVLITGCAHPGIVNIAERTNEIHGGDPVRLALGGFHLRDENEEALRRVLSRLQALGLRRLGPSHCSGDLTREVCRRTLGEGYLELGVGAELSPLGEHLR